MKKKIKYLVLLFIFFGALNVNAATVSQDGFTYSIEGYKAEIYKIDAMQLITNPNYIYDNSPVRTLALDVDQYTNPVITKTTTSSIPKHFIDLKTNETTLTNYLKSQIGNAGSESYIAKLTVQYKVKVFPSDYKKAYKINLMLYDTNGTWEVPLSNISSELQEQVVGVITLNDNSTVPGTNLTINDYLGGFAGNWQTMYTKQEPVNGDIPNLIYMFHNFQIDQSLMDSQINEIYSQNNNGGNNSGNNGNTGETGNNGTGDNGTGNTGTGNNGTGNVTDGPTGNTGAPTDGGNNQVVKVDDTAMNMPISLYVGSTLLLLIGALVISKTMQIEEKQND